MSGVYRGILGELHRYRRNDRRTSKDNSRAAAGVAGGVLLGGLIFKDATAAVVGGLPGGLAGGLIGNVMEKKTEDRAATAEEYDYTAEQDNVIRIEQTDVEPARIRQESKVNLMVRYALLTPNADQITVTERWEIRRDGQLMGNPVLTVQRESGTWTNAIPITLPDTAEEGAYEVSVTVKPARLATVPGRTLLLYKRMLSV